MRCLDSDVSGLSAELIPIVILSEAKDLLFAGEQQVLRFAQDDN
jgi:hypothetical protein